MTLCSIAYCTRQANYQKLRIKGQLSQSAYERSAITNCMKGQWLYRIYDKCNCTAPPYVDFCT